MENLTFGEQVKIILKRKNMTIKELAAQIEERTGKAMSRQNLTQRLGRDNFQEQDMRLIAAILGCPFYLSIFPAESTEQNAQPADDVVMQYANKAKWKDKTASVRETAAGNPAQAEYSGHPAGERDMTIGELYKIHEELDELEAAPSVPEEMRQETDTAVTEEAQPQTVISGTEAERPRAEFEGTEPEQSQTVIEGTEPEQLGTVLEGTEPGQSEAEPDGIESGTTEPVSYGEEAWQTVENVPAEDEVQSETGQQEIAAEDAEEDMRETQQPYTDEAARNPEQETAAKQPYEPTREVQAEPLKEPKKERFNTTRIFRRKHAADKTTEIPTLNENKEKKSRPVITPDSKDFEPVIKHNDLEEDLTVGEVNPYTGHEYQSNSVRMHPKRIGYVQVYDRSQHQWTDMTEWAFLGYQERKKALLGKDYEPPIYLD